MAITFYATNNFTGNGTTTAWNISFADGYLNPAYVKARYVDTSGNFVDIPVTSVSGNVVTISPAQPSGRVFQIYRDTQKTQPLVDFVDGAILNEDNLDTVNRQGIMVAAEAADLANYLVATVLSSQGDAADALAAAQAAQATAASAVTTANSASSTAASAVTTAGNAVTTANSAVSTANSAVTTANNAASTANAISDTANTALSNSTTAINTANAAANTANGLADDIASANSAASSAVTIATGAADTAANALSVANGIAGTAQAALDNSNTALSTANSASATANGIADTANQALTNSEVALDTANSAIAAVGTPGKLLRTVVYNSGAGTHTFNSSATKVRITVVGGGAGGSGVVTTTSNPVTGSARIASPGQPGSIIISEVFLPALSPVPTSMIYNVGPGGAGGVGAGSPGAGFASTVTLSSPHTGVLTAGGGQVFTSTTNVVVPGGISFTRGAALNSGNGQSGSFASTAFAVNSSPLTDRSVSTCLVTLVGGGNDNSGIQMVDGHRGYASDVSYLFSTQTTGISQQGRGCGGSGSVGFSAAATKTGGPGGNGFIMFEEYA